VLEVSVGDGGQGKRLPGSQCTSTRRAHKREIYSPPPFDQERFHNLAADIHAGMGGIKKTCADGGDTS